MSPIIIPVDSPPTTFTEGVQASLAPWNDPAGAFAALNAAYAAMFEQVYSIVADQGSPDEPNFQAGWSTLLDPTMCPSWAIPYGAMFSGVFVPPGTSDGLARTIWRAETGFQRGTPQSIVAAAQSQLGGTQSVTLLERRNLNTPDPYHFLLYVRPEELLSQSALTSAVNAVKPAGLQWSLIVTDNWTWNQATGTWAADTMTWQQTTSQQP